MRYAPRFSIGIIKDQSLQRGTSDASVDVQFHSALPTIESALWILN